MGKNRRNATEVSSAETANTLNEPSKELVDKMVEWQRGRKSSPSDMLTKDELDFILNNMENSDTSDDIPTGQLTRVEHASHFEELGLKEEDTLNTNSILRAFSREPDSTSNYMLYLNDNDSVVIYRTNGNVPHYNISKQTKTMEHEKESWVETGKLKIDKISKYTGDDVRMALFTNLHLENYPDALGNLMTYEDRIPKSITFVDVSPVK